MNSETTQFPALFKKNKNNKSQYWKVSIEGDKVVREYGQTGGKAIIVDRTYKGVNIGKKNETTGEEQAKYEAQKLWASQLKKEYKPSDDDEEGNVFYKQVFNKINSQGGTLHNIRGNKNNSKVSSANGTMTRKVTYFPMKAEKFSEFWMKHVGKKDTNSLYFEPKDLYIQPKLDGLRGLSYMDEDRNIHILSRTGKEFVHLESIKSEIKEKLCQKHSYTNLLLDGEMYTHDLYSKKGDLLMSPDRFRIISGGCRSKLNKPSVHEHLFEYHVFDLVNPSDPTMTFENRYSLLKEIFENSDKKCKIKLVETRQLENPTENELWAIHDQFVENRYEGAMVRDKSGIYSSRREPTILKMKPEYDGEFKIVGAKTGEGTEEGCVVYILETESGNTFTCRPRGSFVDRKRAYKEIEKDIGKMYTVIYQAMDEETGIPIHLRGKDIRYD